MILTQAQSSHPDVAARAVVEFDERRANLEAACLQAQRAAREKYWAAAKWARADLAAARHVRLPSGSADAVTLEFRAAVLAQRRAAEVKCEARIAELRAEREKTIREAQEEYRAKFFTLKEEYQRWLTAPMPAHAAPGQQEAAA